MGKPGRLRFLLPTLINKRQIDELATMRFLENGENVVFLGPPGVGKTHLASALGLVAAQHRLPTYYVNCHQLITRRYEKTSPVFTSNKTFSQWNEVFTDVTTASAILDRVLHHCTVINIKGESYHLKERKKFIRQYGLYTAMAKKAREAAGIADFRQW